MLPSRANLPYNPARDRNAPIGCKGFKIVKGPVLGRDRAATLQAGHDFEAATLNPYTIQCCHNPCDFGVEAKFAVIKGIASGVLGDPDGVTPSMIIDLAGWGPKLQGKSLEERKNIMMNQENWPLAHTDVLWNPTYLDDIPTTRLKIWGKKLWNGEVYTHVKTTIPTVQYFNFSLSGEITYFFEKVKFFSIH